MRDIVVTWPKDRRFASYVMELHRARARNLLVNFRVPRLPDFGVGAFDYGAPEIRCYRVHDGFVRGWLKIVSLEHRGLGEVERVPSDPLFHAPGGRYWPPGDYIVCDPEWHDHAKPLPPMMGFRGWRWYTRTDSRGR